MIDASSGQNFWHQKRARNQGACCPWWRPSTTSSRDRSSSPISIWPPKPSNSKNESRKAPRSTTCSIEAFAVVREAGRRVLNMRHFDVQLIGGIVLHKRQNRRNEDRRRQDAGRHAALYLNALEGKGVHVVTVNDYLAKRDSEWMGRLYKFLGLSVGVIVHDLDDQERKDAYDCDITYGTNNEFGFDYLRDNMKFRIEDCVQRGHHLRHRRRSRLHPDRRSPYPADHFGPQRGIHRQVLQGQPHHPQAGARRGDRRQGARRKVHHRRLHRGRETSFGGADRRRRPEARKAARRVKPLRPRDFETNHHVQQSLRAYVLYLNDREYVVKDGQVIIIGHGRRRKQYG